MKDKSLKFVKKSIESGMYKNVKIDDFDTMKEIEFIHFLKSFFKLNEEIIRFDDGILKYSHELKGGGLINASIVHDEDGDFQYFIAEEYICDGTTSFHFSLYEEMLDRLYYLKTFLKKSAPKDLEANPWKYDINYTVGNFVLCSKYSDEFSTEEKPWLKERVTVMLPVRSEFVEKGEMQCQ